MKNSFMDFHPDSYQKKENPAQRIVRVKQDTLEGIVEGYLCLVEEEIKDLSWVVEHSRVVKAYGAAVERLRNLKFDQGDIEAFCARARQLQQYSIPDTGTRGTLCVRSGQCFARKPHSTET